jgi:hypothetical protein
MEKRKTLPCHESNHGRLQELSIAYNRADGTFTFAKNADLMATTVPHLKGGATQIMISR